LDTFESYNVQMSSSVNVNGWLLNDALPTDGIL